MEREGEVTLFVTLRPYRPDDQFFASGQCREIVAGLKVQVFPFNIAPNDALPTMSSPVLLGAEAPTSKPVMMAEQLLRIRAVLGRSIMNASSRLVDFGTIVPAMTGSDDSSGKESNSLTFSVSNGSHRLPLRYSALVAPSEFNPSMEFQIGACSMLNASSR